MVGSAARIAVIDDEAVLVNLLSAALSDAGYEVAASSDLFNAYAFVRTTRPDVVILDLFVGREPAGYEVMRRLAQDPATQHIPVIVSSVLFEPDAARLPHPAVVICVPKPFELGELLDAVAVAAAQSAERALMRS